jgi:uncharacterized membrane protein YkoI
MTESGANAARNAEVEFCGAQRRKENLMKLKLACLSVAAAVAVGLTIGILPASAYTGQQFEKNAKFSMAQARQIALKARPGKITGEELEKERGGSGLRYSFDVKTSSGTQEVGVDAQTHAARVQQRAAMNVDQRESDFGPEYRRHRDGERRKRTATSIDDLNRTFDKLRLHGTRIAA